MVKCTLACQTAGTGSSLKNDAFTKTTANHLTDVWKNNKHQIGDPIAFCAVHRLRNVCTMALLSTAASTLYILQDWQARSQEAIEHTQQQPPHTAGAQNIHGWWPGSRHTHAHFIRLHYSGNKFAHALFHMSAVWSTNLNRRCFQDMLPLSHDTNKKPV